LFLVISNCNSVNKWQASGLPKSRFST